MSAEFYDLIPIITAFGAFALSYYMIPVIIDVSHLKHLFDSPSDVRKLHLFNTPNLGGIAIFGSLFIAFSLSGYAYAAWAPYLVAGLTILFFSGIKDDILMLSPYKKLFLQVGAILAVMLGGDLVITNLGGVFGLGVIPWWAGFGLTFFTMVVVINAYNLIDGIDGLAGGIGVIAASFFAWWFWSTGMTGHATLALTLVGSLLAFLRYNFQPASIFMGDTGSQIVGYLLGFFAVVFVDAGINSTAAVPLQNAAPVLVLAVLIVPLYDTLRVFTIRVFHGHSPFHPDRRHVHHEIIDCGFSHRTSCLIIYTFNLVILGLTVALADLNVNILFSVVLASAVVLFPTLHFKRRILARFGFEMPSVERINNMEQKIKLTRKSVGSEKRELADVEG